MRAAPLHAEIEAAAGRIADHARRTPVIQTGLPGLNCEVELKLEQLQHTGSFKVRGAFNSLLAEKVPEAGVVAASGGNHGAAIGHAAASLGVPARIFVPEIAGPSKVALIRETGADLTVLPGAYADTVAAADEAARTSGALQVHAYDAHTTVHGQGTVMREWEAQGLRADTVLIAVGGGGLIAGALGWLGGGRKVVAVEPKTCATLANARVHGAGYQTQVSGIAANALGASVIGRICLDLVERLEVPSVLVDDEAIRGAQSALWHGLRQLVEPAGAAALAALTSGAYVPAPGERVAALVCGGNIAPNPLT